MLSIECDFNAFGLSDEPEDNCFYSFDRQRVAELVSLIGAKVILFSPDTDTTSTACEAIIEPYREGWRGEPGKSIQFCGVRARPVAGSWIECDTSQFK